MSQLESFIDNRPLLFSIAYRMLGSASDAEDIVQETYLRWQKASEEEINSPRAFLTTVTTRLCIDQLRSAHQQREVYIGPWLPEPIYTANLSERTEMADSLSIAFLVLLESLTPHERAIFLLRQVFDYEYSEIAQIVGKSESNCRQLFHRAQKHLTERRPRYKTSPQQKEELVHSFISACSTGNMEDLLNLLETDIVLYSDGGGKVLAARNPVYGGQNVARFLFGIMKKSSAAGFRVETSQLNGQTGLIIYWGENLYTVVDFEFDNGHISQLHLVVNPDKLAYLQKSQQNN